MSSINICEFPTQHYEVYFVFSFSILITTISKVRHFIPIILNPSTYVLIPPVCSQCPDPPGPLPPFICLVDPSNLTSQLDLICGNPKGNSEVAFLNGRFTYFSQERRALPV